MKQLVECVPNFSEGQNKAVIKTITDAIEAVEGITLLDVDPGKDTNRTVVTFVGEPGPVLEAAFRGIQTARTVIDMRNHQGEHPRMGATDVCPLVPVSNISQAECVALAEKLAKRVGNELQIPVYLYGAAAKTPERTRLPDIRKGEYEALEKKMKDPSFRPDYGPAEFNAQAGATAIGVRDFLLAYNINLNTKDRKFAGEIGLTIREKGRAKRDKNGEIIRDEHGKATKVPGKLQFCQAAGWYLAEYGYAQVTMNLTNYHQTGLHHAFDTVTEEAAKLGLRVTGSELVGLVPKKAVLDAGIHYLRKSGKNIGIPEKEIVHIGILSLGLNDTTPFVPEEKIIEDAIEGPQNELRHMTVENFVHELSSDSMAPGGGSVAALNGALSAALSSMVANLTHGKKEYKKQRAVMTELSIKAQELKNRYIQLIDADTKAFNEYISANRLPKKTPEEQTRRDEALEKAAQTMTLVPMETLKNSLALMHYAETVLKKGNRNAVSDAMVAAVQGEAAATGAYVNVIINLPSVSNLQFKETVKHEAAEVLDAVKQKRKKLEFFALKAIRTNG